MLCINTALIVEYLLYIYMCEILFFSFGFAFWYADHCLRKSYNTLDMVVFEYFSGLSVGFVVGVLMPFAIIDRMYNKYKKLN